MIFEYGVYLTLAISAFLSATLLPGSSEASLLALLIVGKGSPVFLVIFATFGNVLGSIFNWYCGAFLIRFSERKWFPIRREHFHRGVSWFRKYGKYSLLFAWIPIIGDPLTVVAGALKIRLSLFIIFVSIGKLARYLAITYGFLWLLGA